MDASKSQPRAGSRQSGMTLIELMIAMVVFAVGIIALAGLISTSVASNSRSKMDTTSAFLAQMVMDEVGTLSANSSSTRDLTDCAAHDWPVAVAPGGAALSSSRIDFSSATVTNYNMQWVVCTGSVQSTYDVRWNVQQLTPATSLVTVGVRKKGASNDRRYFGLPINVRRIFGP
jgi:type IV pilus modification protein PilV